MEVSQLQQEVEELRGALEVSRMQLQDLNAMCRLLAQAITAHTHYNQTKGQQLKKKRRKYVHERRGYVACVCLSCV
jgi:hypothetical protein